MVVSERSGRGLKAWRTGHRNEWLAALYLIFKGYQILGFRLKTPMAEIDILARKGRYLVVAEVKSRAHRDHARLSLLPDQQDRLLRAATRLSRSRPALRHLTPRLDLIALSPGRFPRHVRNLMSSGRTRFDP